LRNFWGKEIKAKADLINVTHITQWIYYAKEHFNEKEKKIHFLRYDPYTIIEKSGENTFKLNIPM